MKRLSNWLLGAWISVCSLLQVWPEAMLYVWGMMPDDLKDAIPPLYVKAISFSILVMSFLGKMHVMTVQRAKLEQKVEDKHESDI